MKGDLSLTHKQVENIINTLHEHARVSRKKAENCAIVKVKIEDSFDFIEPLKDMMQRRLEYATNSRFCDYLADCIQQIAMGIIDDMPKP